MNLQMEVTNYCNLKCIECPNRFMERKRAHMSMDIFEKIKEDYIQHLNFGTIIFHKDGEPLLHPNFDEMVQSISEVSSAKFDLYTNGIFLTQDVIGLLGSLQNKCVIFISFHFENADGSKNDYEEKSEEIRNIIINANDNIEFVMVSHIIREEDRKRLEDWKQSWDMFRAQNPRLSAVHINEHINPWCERITVGNLVSFEGCPYGDGEHLFIGSTGNVLPCCMDLEEEIVFGNVLSDRKEDIIEKRTSFYAELARKEYNYDLCRKCLKNV